MTFIPKRKLLERFSLPPKRKKPPLPGAAFSFWDFKLLLFARSAGHAILHIEITRAANESVERDALPLQTGHAHLAKAGLSRGYRAHHPIEGRERRSHVVAGPMRRATLIGHVVTRPPHVRRRRVYLAGLGAGGGVLRHRLGGDCAPCQSGHHQRDWNRPEAAMHGVFILGCAVIQTREEGFTHHPACESYLVFGPLMENSQTFFPNDFGRHPFSRHTRKGLPPFNRLPHAWKETAWIKMRTPGPLLGKPGVRAKVTAWNPFTGSRQMHRLGYWPAGMAPGAPAPGL